MPSDKQVLSKLRRKSGKTAKELGTTISQLYKLEDLHEVEQSGIRRTGGRGRPAIEWSVREVA